MNLDVAEIEESNYQREAGEIARETLATKGKAEPLTLDTPWMALLLDLVKEDQDEHKTITATDDTRMDSGREARALGASPNALNREEQ